MKPWGLHFAFADHWDVRGERGNPAAVVVVVPRLVPTIGSPSTIQRRIACPLMGPPALVVIARSAGGSGVKKSTVC